VVHNLVETPLEELCDVFVHEESSTLGSNHFLPNPLDHSHVSPMCSRLSFSPEFNCEMPINNFMICDSNVDLHYEDNTFDMLGGKVDNFLSLNYCSGHDASLDPFCIYLVDKPNKIMWNTFFDFSFDFSMAFSLLKRVLTFLAMITLVFSYCQAC